jgi:hypothetical protein
VTTIAEVLHRAADKFLWNGSGRNPIRIPTCSCFAVAAALGRDPEDYKPFGPVYTGLRRMGVDPFEIGLFDEFEYGPERQAARYAWLKFAAMIAEEQGV